VVGSGVPLLGGVPSFGMPVGPFAMQDIAGIDVGARIRQYLRSIGKERAEGPQSPVPDWLYEMGRYGQKTGAGWYRYENGSRTPIADPLIDELAQKAAAERDPWCCSKQNDEEDSDGNPGIDAEIKAGIGKGKCGTGEGAKNQAERCGSRSCRTRAEEIRPRATRHQCFTMALKPALSRPFLAASADF